MGKHIRERRAAGRKQMKECVCVCLCACRRRRIVRVQPDTV